MKCLRRLLPEIDLDEEKLERYVRELVMSLTGKKMEFKQ